MKVTLYVQVQPDRSPSGMWIYGPKRVKVTRRAPKPDAVLPDSRTIRVEVEIPDDNFVSQAIELQVAPQSALRAVS